MLNFKILIPITNNATKFLKISPKNLNFVLIKLLCSIKYTYEVSDFSLPLCAPRLQDCHVLSIKVGTHTRQSQGCKSGSGSITAAMHTDTGTYRPFNTVSCKAHYE